MSELNGYEVYDHIHKHITGRIAVTREEGKLLFDAIRPGELYVEVGCLWGGTAALAAHKAGHVITIDFMHGGFWSNGDPARGYKIPTPGTLLDNLAGFGVAHKVSVIKKSCEPWPMSDVIKPDIMLVDGDHSFEGCSRDWNTASRLAKRAILVHDYHKETGDHPGVVSMVDKVAMNDDKWIMAERAQSMLLFLRDDEIS